MKLHAKVDTGAEFCIFQHEYADMLEIDLEEGEKNVMATANGTFTTFGHNVSLEVLGLQYDTMVYFAQDVSIRRNVLGRNGWILKSRIGIVDHDQKLYISPYDE